MISFKLKYLFPWLITAALAGCSDSAPDEPVQPEQEPLTYLQLSVAAPDSRLPRGRAVSDEEAKYQTPTPNELIKTIRFIIIDQSGNVEHNIYLAPENTTDKVESGSYLVKQNETKTIYMLANEESINDPSFIAILKSCDPGKNFDNLYRDAFLNKTISLPKSNTPLFQNDQPIPMTEIFQYKVGPAFDETTNEQNSYMASMFITRVATKFTIILTAPASYKPIKKATVTLESIAVNQYLFPNGVTYDPEKPEFATTFDGITNREITDYNVPGNQFPQPFSIELTQSQDQTETGTDINTVIYTAQTYLTETKLAADNNGNQNYKLKLRINGLDFEPTNPSTGILPNLTSLPRNTHVVINLTLTESESELTADVELVPYISVVLEPSFGY